ncbi:hypothetical protein L1987_28158 [Smallanthus sonchifolius]|uniref:Uncharacterized protein n=1 Tax=Smallanthus sonchifolius TaxID=185202 RepID=A0ACB9ID73_9ASTR|nr:hypothetical protein L1987_28158 [Smallanthus sonchifolius]
MKRIGRIKLETLKNNIKQEKDSKAHRVTGSRQTMMEDAVEDAEWHSREDVKRALTLTEYEKAQKTAASKVHQICKGVEIGQNLAADFNVESGELVPMFVPGPFAIAHHLISSWAHQHLQSFASAIPPGVI